MNEYFDAYRTHEESIKERIKKVPNKELLPFFNNVLTTTSNAKHGINRLANEDLIALSDYLGVNPDCFIHFNKIQKNFSKWIIDEKDGIDKIKYIMSILQVSRKVVQLRIQKPSTWKLNELEKVSNHMKNSFFQIFIAQE